jgi:polyisoprenoid-binding protein YceI
MMISSVKGQFGTFDIMFDSESEDLSQATIDVSIEASSVNTKNEQRDEHLKSADFFDVAQFPRITFKSTNIEKKSSDEFQVTGNLTIKDVTKPIVVDVELGGVAKDPWGNAKVGYTATGKINRNEFGLTWNAALETGGVMVSDEVKFSVEAQFVKS